jgi:pilus assembly protein CpaF
LGFVEVVPMLGRFSRQNLKVERDEDGFEAPQPVASPRVVSASAVVLEEPPEVPVAPPNLDLRSETMLDARVRLHRHLVENINLSVLDQLSRDDLVDHVRPIVRDYIRDAGIALNARELDQLVLDTTDEMLGLGPIEPLLKDDSIADILINGHQSV